ncbi:hypothetical protein KVC81_06055 [Helicobacter pylori]|nr:hypothetical protein KVC81_06055 [Helicobacter pylori]
MHVLNKESLNHSFEKLKDATIGESCYKEAHDRIIKKPAYSKPDQRLYINSSAYFRGVSEEIYHYMIGGYGVLDKYLKSHKNEPCNFDHVSNIIRVIACTIEIQKTLGFLTSDLPHLKGNDSKALMQEILQNPPPPPPFNTNIALILSRQAKAIGDFDFDGAFISKEASDLNIYCGGGGTAFPLFCIV